MLQDDSRELSRWLSNRPDARHVVRENAKEIQMSNLNLTRDALVDAAIQRIESASLAEYPREEISLIDVHTVIAAYRLRALAAVQPVASEEHERIGRSLLGYIAHEEAKPRPNRQTLHVLRYVLADGRGFATQQEPQR